MTNESLPTISQETTESVTTNDKTNPQPSTETPLSTNNTATRTPAQDEVKQKINTESNILAGSYRKRDLEKLTQNHRNEIISRDATLRKYKTDLNQKEAAHKQQQILPFRLYKKRKIQATEAQTRGKLSDKLQEEEIRIDNEELIVAISRIAISGSAEPELRFCAGSNPA